MTLVGGTDHTTIISMSINDLLAENQDLRAQNEDLRAEALAWHARAEDQANQVTVIMSLDMFRRLWELLRPAGVNPCVLPED